MNDQFVYTYPEYFDFNRFVERMTPLVKECINWGEYEDCSEDEGVDEIERTDDTDGEILNMFIRMGIKKLDGKRDFDFTDKQMTYIEVPVVREDGLTDIYSVEVFGTITIEKDGMI